jgi:DNA-binding NarL/FixJ family response regulator
LFCEGLAEILGLEHDLVVVNEAVDSGSAVEAAAREQPDVLLLDVNIPGGDPTTTVELIKDVSPRTQILVLSMYDGPQLLHRMLAAGVRGYLLKSVSRHELIEAIRTVHNESDRAVLAVSNSSLAGMRDVTTSALTDREIEILQLTAFALSNYQISARVGLTEATVKRHLRNIIAKLNAVSRIDAVNKATDVGLITAAGEYMRRHQRH